MIAAQTTEDCEDKKWNCKARQAWERQIFVWGDCVDVAKGLSAISFERGHSAACMGVSRGAVERRQIHQYWTTSC